MPKIKKTNLPDTRNPEEIKELDWLIKASRVFLSEAPTWHFVNLSLIPEIAEQQDKNPHYIMVKLNKPINPDNITSPKEPVRQSLCRIHHLYSANILFGYIIVVLIGVITVRKNLVSIVRLSSINATKFNATEMVFQDTNLSLFYSDDGAALICFSEHFSNLPAEILKGSML